MGKKKRPTNGSEARATTGGPPVSLALRHLHLDPDNPRLPEDVKGASEPRILRYFRENGELNELARSMADNGYFVQEPILVVPRDAGGYKVVEGNRRLATLKLLLDGDADAFIEVELTDQRRSELSTKIPAVVLESEDDLHRYVGFRHISGLQPWSPEAKARYLYREVEKEAHNGSKKTDPFRTIGRRVGLVPSQVRKAYLAYATLRYGADQLGLDVQGVIDHKKMRFGVWMRAMESPGIRAFVGLDPATDYRGVKKAIEGLSNSAKLREVIDDIGPVEGEPVLSDSRHVTIYARILAHPEAREIKRAEKSLDIAKEIVSKEALAGRVARVEKTLDHLARQISALTPPLDDNLVMYVEAALRAARRLSGTVKGFTAEDAE